MVSILILTRNEERDLPGCLASVQWSDDVHVLDSLSADRTVEIAQQSGARVTQRKFDNWASHQNWALKNLPFKYPWVFYLDADERISDELRRFIGRAVRSNPLEVAFRVRRRDYFMDGTWLKHAQITSYYIRLFRPGVIGYERLVNPVTVVNGTTGVIGGYLDHHPFSKGIGFWLQRHIQYAAFEAAMLLNERRASTSWFQAFAGKNPEERKRAQKRIFYSLPFRPLIKFGYMVVWRRAFLDGRAGLTYSVLQSIYEYLIVLKARELENAASQPAANPDPQRTEGSAKPSPCGTQPTPAPQ